MRYTILKQWSTLDGAYHSSTVDKADYDSAFGTFHSMVLPMQNDSNVAYFRFTLVDEYGGTPAQPISWTRPAAETVIEQTKT